MKASFGAAALACALLLCAAPQVSAGSLQDAAAARARGDYATAIRLLQRLAEQGNATAQCLLGGMYENGEGVPRDYAEAVRWYRRAADQEDARGKFFLGTMYGQGKGVPQDLVQAYVLLDRASAEIKEAADARDSLQNIMTSTQIDAAQKLLSAAEQKMTEQKPGRALSRADLVDGQAAFMRGDWATAMRLWRPLAERGIAEAQQSVGMLYDFGFGVPQDHAEALRWYRKAADQNNASAQMMIGQMYAQSRGVPKNYAEAAKWYRKAADQGLAHAQVFLGLMYMQGSGLPQDNAEAAKWISRAAEPGDAEGQKFLGMLYAMGHGVPKDYVIAYMWLNLAAAQGDKHAAEDRDRIAKLMTPEQIGEGQKLAREWKPKSPEVIPTPKKYTKMPKEQWGDALDKIFKKYTQKSMAACVSANENNVDTAACLKREERTLREIFTVCGQTKFDVDSDALLLRALDHCIDDKLKL